MRLVWCAKVIRGWVEKGVTAIALLPLPDTSPVIHSPANLENFRAYEFYDSQRSRIGDFFYLSI